MRVELIYSPGCSFYRKTLDTLQTVIAEERLPIPVELVEKTDQGLSSPSHFIRIDGDEIGEELPFKPQGEFCRLYTTRHGVSGTPCVDNLRDILYRKWKELTEAPLAWMHSS